jgi:hypothetical protein
MTKKENLLIQGEWYTKLRARAEVLVKNHWFLCGVTAGATFFVLALIAALCAAYFVNPGSKTPEPIKKNKSNVIVKTIK